MKNIHLICNAHLDPVWLWRREEGIAEAMSTFRVAAIFCDEYDDFVFCHNEVVLYEWVEQYEPSLFKRIQKLVKAGKWHIMGGWYLQPDCNMITGESAIRQINLGKEYFQEKFGVYPTTAINFDPFGHSRGLVQIMVKAGFDSYLFMRPDKKRCDLPAEVFRWQGYDGSELTGHRIFGCYMTLRGTACKKLQDFIKRDQDHDSGALLWGIGNHGGGPSREDLKALTAYIAEHPELNIIHSTPENFFRDIKESGAELPVHDKEMNFFATGCYTSQVRIKQQHRKLESELNLTEKMASAAWVKAGFKYPQKKLREASIDLAFSEFHDILPGSSIKLAEDDSLQQMAHGREILSRIRTGAFLSMLQGQKAAKDGDMPLFVWNPHPHEITTVVEAEMQMADQNWDDSIFYDIEVHDGSNKVTSQIEHETSNLNLDWRKKVIFEAKLPPGSIKRFECSPKAMQLNEIPEKQKIRGNSFVFDNGNMRLKINRRTGLIDSFKNAGKELVKPGAGRVLVIQDSADPWGSIIKNYKKRIGSFKLMNRDEASAFAGFSLAPVRIIEDGPVRTVVEALFKYKQSTLRAHYILPKQGPGFDLKLQMNNQQSNCMYKMSWPFIDKEAECVAQDIFGRKSIPGTRDEKVFSQWVAVSNKDSALAVICDSGHGLDFFKGEMRYSLLRSACYSALPLGDRQLISEDRAHDRIDFGEREFCFKIFGGTPEKLLPEMDKHTMIFNEAPPHILFYPGGKGKKVNAEPLVNLSEGPAVMTCCQRSSTEKSLTVRVFNPTPEPVKVGLSILGSKKAEKIKLRPYEYQTLDINPK